MGPLSAWAIRRPIVALLTWVVAIVLAGFFAFTLDGKFNDSFSLPNTQSALAQNFLEEVNPQQADSNSATVVWSPTSGSANDETVKTEVDALLTKVASVQGVTCVTSPYDRTYGTGCPASADASVPFPPGTPKDFEKQVNDAFKNGTTDVTFPEGTPPQAQESLLRLLKANEAAREATSTISTDGTVAYATVTFTGLGQAVANADQAKEFVSVIEAAGSSTLQVGATGQILTAAQSSPGSSEGIGILVAIVILIILFGGLVAAGLPIVVAVVGLIVGQLLILVIARFFDVASFAPQLASMIGLGVGIDYSLFILNR
ncbi:MAG: MMPL family transporter, partial [Candidatus Nanopelagicales bacterium]